MNVKYKLYAILSVLFLLGWQKVKQANNTVKITKLPDRKIKKQTFNENGTIILEEIFFSTDTLADVSKCIKTFYEDGRLKSLGFIKHKFPDDFSPRYQDSFFYSYYRDGSVFQKMHYFFDKLDGSQYSYDSGTHIMKKYECYWGHPYKNYFSFCLDDFSQMYSVSGQPIHSYSNAMLPNYIWSDDTIGFLYTLAIPENFKTTLNIRIITKKKEMKFKCDNYEYNGATDENWYIFNYAGSYGPGILIAELKYYDTTTNKLIASFADTNKVEMRN